MYIHALNFALHESKVCFYKVKAKENVEITIELRVNYSLRSRPNTVYFASCFVNSEDIVIVQNFANKE